MNKPSVWFGWFVMVVINAILFVVPAIMTGFPSWAVVLLLVALEGIPLLWMAGVIPTNIFITGTFIGGLWTVIQWVVLLATVICVAFFTHSFLIVLLANIVALLFFIARAKVMIGFLSSKNS